jgi:hypothetical protein
MKELGLPLGFLNVSPYELDENNGQIKPVVDNKRTKRRGKKKKKKQALGEDVIKVRVFVMNSFYIRARVGGDLKW